MMWWIDEESHCSGHSLSSFLQLKEESSNWYDTEPSEFSLKTEGINLVNDAVANDHIECVEELIKAGVDLNSLDEHGNGPFHVCIQQNCSSGMYSLLLENGVDVNLQNKAGQTVVFIACKYNNGTVLLQLLDLNPNLEIEDFKGRTCLEISLQKGNYICTNILFDFMPDLFTKEIVNLQSWSGSTFAMFLSKCNLAKKLEDLITLGADVNKRTKGRATSLMFAVRSNSIPAVQCLLDHNVAINETDSSSMSALHWSCSENTHKITSLLVKFGANVNAQNCEGSTPLMLAMQNADGVISESMQTLTQSPNIDINLRDNAGNSVLMHCFSGDLPVIWIDFVVLTPNGKKLLKQKNFCGRTCLHIAAQLDSVAYIQRLLKICDNCLNINCVDHFGYSPLSLALFYGCTNVAEFLSEQYGAVDPKQIKIE